MLREDDGEGDVGGDKEKTAIYRNVCPRDASGSSLQPCACDAVARLPVPVWGCRFWARKESAGACEGGLRLAFWFQEI